MIRHLAIAAALACMTCTANAAGPADSAAVSNEDGKYFDKDSNPTYNIKEDGTVDWFTYSGFRRYHSECHVCHGPEGLGSTYAPSLVESLKNMDYAAFLDVVTNGRQKNTESQHSVMPAFGTNKNVMCYIDDIYVYLRARSDDKLGRGRPQKREDKNPAVAENENACLGN